MAVHQTGKVTGLSNWMDGFRLVESNMLKARRRGIIKWGLLVKKRSIMGVPVRLGNLRSSAFFVIADGESGQRGSFTGADSAEMQGQHEAVVNEARSDAASETNKNQVVGVVGHSAEYAAYVHELETAGAVGYDPSDDLPGMTADQVHSKVGGWKFLATAINETMHQGLLILAKELKIG